MVAGDCFMFAKHIPAAAVIVAAVLTWSVDAAAQARLASATSLRCTFPRESIGTWAKGGAPEATAKPASLALQFEAIDADTGVARIRNGSMTTDVTVRYVDGYLHLMQAFKTGPLFTTTVFEAGAAGGKFKAVHSRHEYCPVPLPDATSGPEQYYGECEIAR